MEKKLLIEINRIQKLMLIDEKFVLQESFSSEILQRIQRVPNFSWMNIIRLVDEIENSHNFFDSTVVARLRAETGTGRIFEVFFEEYNNLTDMVKKRAAVAFIVDKIGLKTEFDDAIDMIRNAADVNERIAAERQFLGNLNDPETKKFFQEDLDEVNSPNIPNTQGEVKGAVDAAMDNWDNIPSRTLSDVAKFMFEKKGITPAIIRQDIHNGLLAIRNIYIPYIIEAGKIITIRKPDFSSLNDELIKRLTDSIVGNLKGIKSGDALDNKYMDEINQYMKLIWNDCNTLRLRFKRAVPQGLEYNANIMDFFQKRLEDYGFSYEERQILLREFAKADPTGKGVQKILSISEQESFSKEIINDLNTLVDDYAKKMPGYIKKTARAAGGILNFGNPLMQVKELRLLLYEKGLPRTYADKIVMGLIIGKVVMPAIVAGIWSVYQMAVLNFGDNPEYKGMNIVERYMAIFKKEYMSIISEFGLMDLIWPWGFYWDNFVRGVYQVVNGLSEGVYKGMEGGKILLDVCQRFFLGAMGKAKEFINSGKEKAEDMIKNAKKENETTTADTSGTVPINVVDTTGVQVDTTGEEQ